MSVTVSIAQQGMNVLFCAQNCSNQVSDVYQMAAGCCQSSDAEAQGLQYLTGMR